LGEETFFFTLTTRLGSRGNEVTELQKRLTKEGFYTGPITGYFGKLTETAVKAYQKAHGIDQVGIVGPKTRNVLNGDFRSLSDAEIQAKIDALRALLAELMKQLPVS
jgi:peptidoglycan hydrolase-like protein with peptidoglycan-binding domain